MSLRPLELQLLAAELSRELQGAVVQQVHAPTPARVYLALRLPGRTETLLACAEPGAARLAAVLERPPNPPTPPGWQSVWRRELVGAAFRDAEALPARRLLLLHFSVKAAAPTHRTLVLEVGTPPGLALVTEAGRALAVSAGFRGELRPGKPWTAPEEAPVREAPSRLLGDRVHLRLAHAAQAIFEGEERRLSEDARAAPLRARLKRLERTRLKVLEEASRGPRAQALKQEGELLAWNQARLTRGLASVTLERWTADGVLETVEVALDPRRTPAEEVAWRFHQARRLERGATLASARLAVLEQERLALQAGLQALHDAPPPALAAAPRPVKARQAPLPPYREYLGHGGQRLWVGRGAAHNDELTFHVARPFHVWFHARGVPGAHVVVPLEKGAELTQEVLLDAAHLALHHSDAKGEPRGEVSYTPVKFVRKAGAPGAVRFTRERSIALRVEPGRLQRLLATAERVG
jgi:predicted ribosome quality control (RQC) complex YloA/Tae2 family protein